MPRLLPKTVSATKTCKTHIAYDGGSADSGSDSATYDFVVFIYGDTPWYPTIEIQDKDIPEGVSTFLVDVADEAGPPGDAPASPAFGSCDAPRPIEAQRLRKAFKYFDNAFVAIGF